MLTAKMIKDRAKELGAAVCGIGKLDIFKDEIPGRDPFFILPNAKTIIGFGFPVPRGFYKAMETGNQFYTYTSVGVKYNAEEFAEIFLLKIGGLIEDNGYDACLQKFVPNLKIKGDKTTNPEAMDTYELVHAVPVEPGKPAPEVLIDFGKAAKACGIGHMGKHGTIVNDKYGPFMRYSFIITDAPLETDEEYKINHCENCNECKNACIGSAIDENGVDTWQCSVYYKGAHKSNPFIGEEFLKDNPNREAILNGEFRFDAESARKIYSELDFLPDTKWGYSACLCGKKCDIACYKKIKGVENL